MTANSSLVAITTGGTELLKPCGSSTATYGILLSCRNLTVRSAFFSLNQLPWRNSTAMGSSSRARVSRMGSRASFDGKTHFGNWTKTAPILPASTSGSSASRNCVYTASNSSAGMSLLHALLLGKLAAQLFANRLGQPRHLGWLTRHQRMRLDVEDEILWRSLDPRLCRALVGQRVVRGVDLHDRELARVETQALLGARDAFRVEHAGHCHRRVGPARGAESHLALADLDGRSTHVAGLLYTPPGDLYTRVVWIGLGHRESHSVMNFGLRWMSICRSRSDPEFTNACGWSASTTAISPAWTSRFDWPSSNVDVPSITMRIST